MWLNGVEWMKDFCNQEPEATSGARCEMMHFWVRPWQMLLRNLFSCVHVFNSTLSPFWMNKCGFMWEQTLISYKLYWDSLVKMNSVIDRLTTFLDLAAWPVYFYSLWPFNSLHLKRVGVVGEYRNHTDLRNTSVVELSHISVFKMVLMYNFFHGLLIAQWVFRTFFK